MLYYQLFKERIFIRYAIYFGIALSFMFYFSNMTAVAILCAPMMGHPWDLTVLEKCSRARVLAVVLGTVNSAVDIYLLILPIPVVLPLHLPLQRKIGVLAIFMVGLL